MSLLGSIAGRMATNMGKNDDAQREMRKAEALMELQKKYDDEIIDSAQTRIVGNEEIRYSKRGREISRRQLSPEELLARKQELDKAAADVRRSTADAGKAEFDLEYADDKFNLDSEATRQSIAESRARISQGERRLSLDAANSAGGGNLGADLYKQISEARQLIVEASESDDVSSAVQLDRFEAELSAAMQSGNKNEVRRVTDLIIGALRNEGLRRRKAAEAGESDLIQAVRALDGSNDGVRVPLRPGER